MALVPSVAGPPFESDARFSNVRGKGGNVDKSRDFGIVSGLGDHDAAPRMAHEYGPSRLSGECLLGGLNVVRQRRQRVLDKGNVVTLLGQDIGYRLPASLVDERSMDQHDVVGRSLGEFGCLSCRREDSAGKNGAG